jgi:toxin ParE1/3/4
VAHEIAFTFRSCGDLNEIWESIAQPLHIYDSYSKNLAAAEGFADNFEHLCGLLTEHPEIGLNRDELHLGVRSVAFERYVVFYRVRGECIEVLRVMSATKDVPPGRLA